MDISTVALRLVCGGVLDRLPGLTIVLANLGGVLPFVVERIEHYWSRMHAGERPLPMPPREALRRLW